MTGKNLWRLCKVYGRQIGYPMLKPHDLRHGVAMEIYEQHGDPEEVRAMLGHKRLETTQIYMRIRPRQLKQAVAFYDAPTQEHAGWERRRRGRGLRNLYEFLKHEAVKHQQKHLGGPNGIRTRVYSPPRAFSTVSGSYVLLTQHRTPGIQIRRVF